jgi:hypothetical protein
MLRVVWAAEDLVADEAVLAGGAGTEEVADVGIEGGGDVGSDDLPLLHPAAISAAAPTTATRRNALTRPVWSTTLDQPAECGLGPVHAGDAHQRSQ